MASRRMLLAMTDAMQQEFGELASAEGIEWVGVTTCDEARGMLAGNVSTIVTYETLPDGNWYCLLQEIVGRGLDVGMIVVLPEGSDATSVTSCGVDVIEYPLDAATWKRLAKSVRDVASRAAVA